MAKDTFSGFRPCVTGKSRSGHCGTAAFCPEPYRCCEECPENCNIRCGQIDGTDRENVMGEKTVGPYDKCGEKGQPVPGAKK